MADFRAGTQEQVDSGEAEYVSGGVVSKEIKSEVGATTVTSTRGQGPGTATVIRKVGGEKVQHRTVTRVTQGPDGSVTGGETVLYTVKDGKYVPTAITKDGGRSYQYEDPRYPKMTGVASDKLKEDLKNPASDINKNSQWQIDTSTKQAGIPNKDIKNLSRSAGAQALSADEQVSLNNLANFPTRAGTRNSQGAFGDPMTYPLNMDDRQDKIKIDMIKFNPRRIGFSGSGFQDRAAATTKDIIGTVTLAIPGGIRDDNQVKWGGQDMNAAQAKLAGFALDLIDDGKFDVSAATKQLTEIGGDLGTKRALALGFAGAAAGVQGLLARTEGAILNPNTELLFSGPALRAFTFQFPLSPRSQKESEMVQRIIRFFKQGMAVQRVEGGLFLKAPNVFNLKFLNGSSDHTFLPKIKTCALLNCSVDYTPDGNYSTYTNSSMTNYTMSLTFNELDPLFNDEYETEGEGATTNNLGY